MYNFFLSIICIFFIPYFCRASFKEYLSNKKIFLKYNGTYCLYPENVIENDIIEIATDECDKVAHEYEVNYTHIYMKKYIYIYPFHNN